MHNKNMPLYDTIQYLIIHLFADTIKKKDTNWYLDGGVNHAKILTGR